MTFSPRQRREPRTASDAKSAPGTDRGLVPSPTLAFRKNVSRVRVDRSAHDGLSRPSRRGIVPMRKAELSAHGREAQNLSVDAYDVVGAAAGVAMPANEFRFLPA